MKPHPISRPTPSRPAPLSRRFRGPLGSAALALGGVLCATALTASTRPAQACGYAEAGGCGDAATDAANEARWMLKRVVAAVQANEPKALDAFTHGTGGFRTQDTYVFCIGPDGRIDAHPDPKLMGKDARSLRDPSGKPFGADMLDKAKPGQVATVSYLFPQPNSDVPVPKTSFVTRVKDQVCGVGYYDADTNEASGPASPASSATRLAQLRQRLDAGVPANLRAEWTAFLAALDEQLGGQEAALAKARESIGVAERALGAPAPRT
jgi:hypothetical protein